MYACLRSLEDQIRQGFHTLRETLQQDKELTTNDTAIGIIGPDGALEGAGITVDFRILEGSPIDAYLHTMQPKEALAPPASAPAPAASALASAPGVPPPASGDEDVQTSE